MSRLELNYSFFPEYFHNVTRRENYYTSYCWNWTTFNGHGHKSDKQTDPSRRQFWGPAGPLQFDPGLGLDPPRVVRHRDGEGDARLEQGRVSVHARGRVWTFSCVGSAPICIWRILLHQYFDLNEINILPGKRKNPTFQEETNILLLFGKVLLFLA